MTHTAMKHATMDRTRTLALALLLVAPLGAAPQDGGSTGPGPEGPTIEVVPPDAQETPAGEEPGTGRGEGQGQDKEPRRGPDLLENDPFAPDPSMEELQRLFAEIELTLGRIDGMLLEASSGDVSQLEQVDEAGLERLLDAAPQSPDGQGGSDAGSAEAPAPGVAGVLQRSERQAITVLGGIDRVLELAAQQQSSSSIPMPGDDPMSGQQNNRTERSQSPEGPQPTQPEQPQDSEGQEPRSPKDSDKPADQNPAGRMPDQETAGTPPVDPAAENWGELPVHYRDIFRAEGGQGMPVEYRDWIDAYYRRLNQRSGG